MPAVSVEYIEAREDEIARMLTAIDDLDEVRHVLRYLHKKQMMKDQLYRELRHRLDRIADALATGKHNTAQLRNTGGY